MQPARQSTLNTLKAHTRISTLQALMMNDSNTTGTSRPNTRSRAPTDVNARFDDLARDFTTLQSAYAAQNQRLEEELARQREREERRDAEFATLVAALRQPGRPQTPPPKTPERERQSSLETFLVRKEFRKVGNVATYNGTTPITGFLRSINAWKDFHPTDYELYWMCRVHLVDKDPFNVATFLDTLVTAEPELKSDWVALSSRIQAQFEDINAAWIREQAFFGAKQTGSLSTYVDKFRCAFEHTKLKKRGCTLNDVTAAFYYGLQPAIATELSTPTCCADTTFEEFVKDARMVEARLKSKRPTTKSRTPFDTAPRAESKCNRCQRSGHLASDCFATSHFDGTPISAAAKPPRTGSKSSTVQSPNPNPKPKVKAVTVKVQELPTAQSDSSSYSDSDSDYEYVAAATHPIRASFRKVAAGVEEQYRVENLQHLSKGILETGIPVTVFYDSGSMLDILSTRIVDQYSLPKIPLKKNILMYGFQKDCNAETVSYCTGPISFRVGDHVEMRNFIIADTNCHDVVVGLSWMNLHEAKFDHSTNTLYFGECCASHMSAPDIKTVPFTVAGALPLALHEHELQTSLNDIAGETPLVRIHTMHAHEKLDVATVSRHEFYRLVNDGDNVMVAAVKVMRPKPPSNNEADFPEVVKEFADVFEKKDVPSLPEHRPYDLNIELLPNSKPTWGTIYNMSSDELAALKEYIDENLASGFIRPSKSPYGAPVLVVKKKDGSLRFCIDYRQLNKQTVKDRYPLPLISELLDRIRQRKLFSKIDLRGAYNLIRIKKGHEWMTAFRTRYGHFEYCVMPFGLANAPSVFQRMMNAIFHDFLDDFMVVYLDDILIFSDNVEQHNQHLRKVLQRLRENNLIAKGEKCEFFKDSIEFLGYVISNNGVHMDQKKVQSILDWAAPKKIKELQRFLGFANFYRRFISNYAKLTKPLTMLLKKATPYNWTSAQEESFQQLKAAFASAPILASVDFNAEFILETDASDYAIGAVLSQRDADNVEHPVAFYSRSQPGRAQLPSSRQGITCHCRSP